LVQLNVIIAAAAVSLVCLTFLIPWELTDRHPVIDLHLFSRRNFRVGSIVIGIAYFAFSGSTSSFHCGCKPRSDTRPPGRASPLLRGFADAGRGAHRGQNMNRMNLRLAVSFAFMIFGCAIFGQPR
jgi:DHA2 family multidrug resistance protein